MPGTLHHLFLIVYVNHIASSSTAKVGDGSLPQYVLVNKKIFILDNNKIINGTNQNLNNVQMTKLNSYFILSTCAA